MVYLYGVTKDAQTSYLTQNKNNLSQNTDREHWRRIMANFQPLHKETHANVKIQQNTNVSDLKEQHALGIVAQEFALAGAQYPVVFVKQKDGDEYFPVAVLGLEPGKNLFVNDEGKWEGMYMPARYTHKPFSVVPSKEDPNVFGIAIDMDSPVVSESEGEALFADGKETEYLDARKKSLISYVEHEHITKAFVQTLVELDLLVQQNINVKVQDQEYNLNGLYMVDEKKFNELSNDDFLKLRERGFLGPIFAHLGSMHQVTTLIQMQAKRLG
jgi:hypothetical protein